MSAESPLMSTEAGDNLGLQKFIPFAPSLVFPYCFHNHCNDIDGIQAKENSDINSILICTEIIEWV
jgi:hypothetical protein